MNYWKEAYQEDPYTNGYLEIIYTRVIYINEDLSDDVNAQKLKEIYPDIHAIVEFIFLTDYYYSAPYYWESGMTGRGNNVIVNHDGTMAEGLNLLNLLRSQTYSSDFSGIIKSISNLGSSYNGVYYLKER